MERIDEIKQFILEFYSRSFKQKEPTASLFNDIEILMLMIEENRDDYLPELDAKQILMYNYLLNEMVAEIPKRQPSRHISEGIARVAHTPRPISMQTIRDIFKPKPKVPDFAMIEEEFISKLTRSPGNAAVVEQINLNSEPDLRESEQHPSLPEKSAPTFPSLSETVMEQRGLIQNLELLGNIHVQPLPEIIDEQNVTLIRPETKAAPSQQTSDVAENIDEQISALPMAPLANVAENIHEQNSSLRMRSDMRPPDFQMQQFSVGEFSIIPPTSAPIISVEERPNRQEVQSDELELYVPEVPGEDIFIEEFEALFERRRREKAAVDYAARATRRTMRSTENLIKYRNLQRSIANLRPIPNEIKTLRVIPVYPQIFFWDMSSVVPQLMITESTQERLSAQERRPASSIDRAAHREFTNYIADRPQSTPETTNFTASQRKELSFSGKQKSKKWTSALPVLEEDQTDVQRATDALDLITMSKSTELQQTPLREMTQFMSRKPQQILSHLPVLPDEIEILPDPGVSNQDGAAEYSGLIVQEEIPPTSDVRAADTHYSIAAQQLQRAKRPKLLTEEANPATKKRKDADPQDTVFKEYLQSWKNSFLLSAFSSHSQDVHFPVDLLKFLELGKPVHQVLKDVIGSSDRRSQFLPSTSTRKEAARRIRILLELKTQNVIDFETQDGEVIGIHIKDN